MLTTRGETSAIFCCTTPRTTSRRLSFDILLATSSFGFAVRRFMPAWTPEEMLAAGRHMATKLQTSSDDEMKSLFEDDKLLERIEQFGGIPRYVLPARPARL